MDKKYRKENPEMKPILSIEGLNELSKKDSSEQSNYLQILRAFLYSTNPGE